jgi:hypothetical protein
MQAAIPPPSGLGAEPALREKVSERREKVSERRVDWAGASEGCERIQPKQPIRRW